MILEIVANVITTISIWLAVKNNIHTWTTSIVGGLLFLILFFQNQLYADATLQIFFVMTSLMGLWNWQHPKFGQGQRPITHVTATTFYYLLIGAIVAITGYGEFLSKHTNDFMPYTDASVLVLSIIAQCLLIQRKVESWMFWIIVNTASVGLYLYRGMDITAILYSGYWINAWYGWYRWTKIMRTT